jgi:hypothetical protein
MDKSQQPMVEPELVTTATREVRKGIGDIPIGMKEHSKRKVGDEIYIGHA